MIIVKNWETGEIEGEYENNWEVFKYDVKTWGWRVALWNLWASYFVKLETWE